MGLAHSFHSLTKLVQSTDNLPGGISRKQNIHCVYPLLHCFRTQSYPAHISLSYPLYLRFWINQESSEYWHRQPVCLTQFETVPSTESEREIEWTIYRKSNQRAHCFPSRFVSMARGSGENAPILILNNGASERQGKHLRNGRTKWGEREWADGRGMVDVIGNIVGGLGS